MMTPPPFQDVPIRLVSSHTSLAMAAATDDGASSAVDAAAFLAKPKARRCIVCTPLLRRWPRRCWS